MAALIRRAARGLLLLPALLGLVPLPATAAPDPDLGRYVAEASRRFAMPEAWIWRVIAIESGGRASIGGRPIRSPKGAIGLMQLMPRTWAGMRAAYALGDDPDDPRDNIFAGTAYLRLMYDRFGYPGLFGAYNAGPERYGAYLRNAAPLPKETVAYLSSAVGRPSRRAADCPTMASGRSFPQKTLFAISRMTAEPVPADPRGSTEAMEPLFVIRRE